MSWYNKIGQKSISFLRNLPGYLAKGGRVVQAVSRKVGDVENVIDKTLEQATHYGVTGDLARLIRDDPIYGGIKGTIDSARDIVESNTFDSVLQILENVDHDLHKADEIHPHGRVSDRSGIPDKMRTGRLNRGDAPQGGARGDGSTPQSIYRGVNKISKPAPLSAVSQMAV